MSFDAQRKLDKEDFIAPEGWKWDEDWFINPEIRCVCMMRAHSYLLCILCCVRVVY